jgi:hydroxymethylpyrimidine pyrophosphatase-like HAD family hydrolase
MNINSFEFLKSFKRNITSQNGEDDIIEELLNRLNIHSGYVCEFGAWDGVYLSNTFNLIRKGFKSVLIEGDPEKFKDLEKLAERYPTITPICAWVDHVQDSPNLLDKLLQRTQIPIDFDILSIDIDSFDYQVWESVEVYRPKIVIIETNNSVSETDLNHIHTPGIYQGTGIGPMLLLGKKKGYRFLVSTGNMFFIREDLYPQLELAYSLKLTLTGNGFKKLILQ